VAAVALAAEDLEAAPELAGVVVSAAGRVVAELAGVGDLALVAAVALAAEDLEAALGLEVEGELAAEVALVVEEVERVAGLDLALEGEPAAGEQELAAEVG